MAERILTHIKGFDWDFGNQTKNWSKHEVNCSECEQVFFNQPLLLYEDIKHSKTEYRGYALGVTDEGRELFCSFYYQERINSYYFCPRHEP